MIATPTLVAASVSLLLCLALPFVPLFLARFRRQHVIRPWLAGMLAFTVSQMLLRIPLIQAVLPNWEWYIRLSLDPVAHGLFLAVTAGIFEETARFLAFRFLVPRSRRWADGIAFGFGHGGIEAILITGISLANLLVVFIAINSGTIDSLLAGVSPTAAQAVRQQALSVGPADLLLGGFERLLAAALHIGMTMIVLVGLYTRRPWTHLAAAIGVHTLIDAAAAILPRVTAIRPIVLELILALLALPLIAYTLRARRRLQDAPPAANGSVRRLGGMLLLLVFTAAVLTGCGTGGKLAAGFEEAAVKEAARTAIGHMNAGEYARISDEMVREDLKPALSASVLEGAAGQILAGAGAFDSFTQEVVAGTRDRTTNEDYAVAVMIAKYADKSVTYTLSFDKNLKLVGFFMR